MPEVEKDFKGHFAHDVVIYNFKDQRMVRASLSLIPHKGEILFAHGKAGRKSFQVDNVIYDLIGGVSDDNVQIGTIGLIVTPIDFHFDPAQAYGDFKHTVGQDVTLSEL